jgi:hypothetical protein
MSTPMRVLSEEELGLFSERVRRELESRPLDLELSLHQRRVAELLRSVGDATFYQLLDLGPGATIAEVHDAYSRLARSVHPVHALRLGLPGREGVLQLLFEKATLAFLTLIHPDRRKEYDRSLGERLWSSDLGFGRSNEARQVARRYYVQAQTLAAQEEWHLVIELLQQAVRLEPRPEYFFLLGQCQARNPHWLRHAEASLQRALAAGTQDPGVASLLEQVQSDLRAQSGEAEAEKPAKSTGSFFRRRSSSPAAQG